MANENASLSKEQRIDEDLVEYLDFDELEAKLESQLEEELSGLGFFKEEKEKIGDPDALGKVMLDEVWKQFGNQIGLDIKDEINWDWFILLVAKTGMRFSEALAITPGDFDFARQTLSISKTWDYKGDGGFLPTKNKSSVRKIQIDWQIVVKFSELTKGLPEDEPIFVGETKIYNSTVNDVLTRHCKACGISEISIHGLRHTHASLLLFAGVSIASVARRLGHASMTTTQKTYLHIIQELENKDVDLVMRTLSGL